MSFVYSIPGVRKLQTKLNQLTSYIPPPPKDTDDTGRPCKILLVHCHPNMENSYSVAIANQVEQAAKESGHEIRRISLYNNNKNNDPKSCYRPNLSRQERDLYFEMGTDLEHRKLEPDVKQHLKLLQWCDTLVFVYPTWWMNIPASLKGFFDRTLVHDIAWSLPSSTSSDSSASTGLIPKLTNITRIVGVSTYGATYSVVTMAGDNGRRMIANAIRPILSPEATVTWLGLYNMDFVSQSERVEFLEQVERFIKNL